LHKRNAVDGKYRIKHFRPNQKPMVRCVLIGKNSLPIMIYRDLPDTDTHVHANIFQWGLVSCVSKTQFHPHSITHWDLDLDSDSYSYFNSDFGLWTSSQWRLGKWLKLIEFCTLAFMMAKMKFAFLAKPNGAVRLCKCQNGKLMGQGNGRNQTKWE